MKKQNKGSIKQLKKSQKKAPKAEDKSLVVVPVEPEKDFVQKEEAKILKQMFGGQLSDVEFSVFVRQINRSRLDPFSRQVYAIKRKTWDSGAGAYVEKMSIETSIDGFRLIAQRTGQYAGQTGPFWCGDDGKWKDVWVHDVPPKAAKVGVLRHGFSDVVWGVAKYTSFVQTKQDGTPNKIWKTMPEVMLAKCAEAQALRRAFPNELSGLYTEDEMASVTAAESFNTDPNVKQIADESSPDGKTINVPNAAEIEAYFNEAVNHLETAQSGKQLDERGRKYRPYPFWTDDHKKKLADVFSRRLDDLTKKIDGGEKK